jgi:hypothetical protein
MFFLDPSEIVRLQGILEKHPYLQNGKMRKVTLSNSYIIDCLDINTDDTPEEFSAVLVAETIHQPHLTSETGEPALRALLTYLLPTAKSKFTQDEKEFLQDVSIRCRRWFDKHLSDKKKEHEEIGFNQPDSTPFREDQTIHTELLDLLQPLSKYQEDIQKAYRASVPHDPLDLSTWALPEEGEWEKFIATIVEKLNDVPIPDNRIPALFYFIEYLASALSEKAEIAKRQLQTMVYKYCSFYDLNEQDIDQFLKKITKPQNHATNKKGKPPYPRALLMMLTRAPGKKHFFVDAWLRIDHRSLPLPLPQKTSSIDLDKAYSRSQLPNVLADLLKDVMRCDQLGLEAKKDLQIEFFLPCELFEEGVENWPAIRNNISGSAYPLTLHHPVIIRSSERYKSYEDDAPLWQQKSQHLSQHALSRNKHSIHWIDNEISDKNVEEHIYANLVEPDIVCLGMTLPPSTVATSCKKELFASFVKSGTPVAFWPRHPQPDPQWLKSILLSSDTVLSELPDVLKRERVNAHKSSSSDHPGWHLTLFWDEWETRLPVEDATFKQHAIRS